MKKFSYTLSLSRTFDTYAEAEVAAKKALGTSSCTSEYFVVETLASVAKPLPECVITKF